MVNFLRGQPTPWPTVSQETTQLLAQQQQQQMLSQLLALSGVSPDAMPVAQQAELPGAGLPGVTPGNPWAPGPQGETPPQRRERLIQQRTMLPDAATGFTGQGNDNRQQARAQQISQALDTDFGMDEAQRLQAYRSVQVPVKGSNDTVTMQVDANGSPAPPQVRHVMSPDEFARFRGVNTRTASEFDLRAFQQAYDQYVRNENAGITTQSLAYDLATTMQNWEQDQPVKIDPLDFVGPTPRTGRMRPSQLQAAFKDGYYDPWVTVAVMDVGAYTDPMYRPPWSTKKVRMSNLPLYIVHNLKVTGEGWHLVYDKLTGKWSYLPSDKAADFSINQENVLVNRRNAASNEKEAQAALINANANMLRAQKGDGSGGGDGAGMTLGRDILIRSLAKALTPQIQASTTVKRTTVKGSNVTSVLPTGDQYFNEVMPAIADLIQPLMNTSPKQVTAAQEAEYIANVLGSDAQYVGWQFEFGNWPAMRKAIVDATGQSTYSKGVPGTTQPQYLSQLRSLAFTAMADAYMAGKGPDYAVKQFMTQTKNVNNPNAWGASPYGP